MVRSASNRAIVIALFIVSGLVALYALGPTWAPLAAAESSAPLPTAEEIRERLEERFETLEDMSFRLQSDHYHYRNGNMVANNRQVVEGRFLNSEWLRLEPKEGPLVNTMWLINLADKRVARYIPFMSSQTCMTLEEALQTFKGIPLRFDRLDDVGEDGWLTMLGIDEQLLDSMEVLRTEMRNDTEHVVVRLRDVKTLSEELDLDEWIEPGEAADAIAETETLEVWIDTVDWMITRVDTYDENERLVAQVLLSQVKVNQGLTVRVITNPPPALASSYVREGC